MQERVQPNFSQTDLDPQDHIEATPGMRGGKPRIAGARITVADIVLMHRRLGRALERGNTQSSDGGLSASPCMGFLLGNW